ARRDAAVAGTDAAAKGMRRHVEPAGAEVETNRLCGRLPKGTLRLDRVLAFEDVVRRFLAGAEDSLNQRHQLVAQGGKDLRDLGSGGARLVFVEQGVIRT